MKTLLICGVLVYSQNCLLILLKPPKLHHLTSLFTNASAIPKLGLTGIHFWAWMCPWIQLYFYSFIMFAYSYPMNAFLTQMKTM